MRPKQHYPSDNIVNVPGLHAGESHSPMGQQSQWPAIFLRLLLAVPLLIFGLIAAFFGTMLKGDLGGILMGYAVANIGIGAGALLAKRQKTLWFVGAFGILLILMNLAIVTSKLPTK